MANPQPGISIIILSYKRMQALTALLSSLHRQNLGDIPLEVIICNNSAQTNLKPNWFSPLGRLLSRFSDLKIFNSSYNWLCRARFTIATLARYETILFLDDDVVLLDPDFIRYLLTTFQSLNPTDMLSCWNELWVEVQEDGYNYVSPTFTMPNITELVRSDVCGPGICLFHRQLLANGKLWDYAHRFPAVVGMGFAAISALEWNGCGYYLPSYGKLRFHRQYRKAALHQRPTFYPELNALYKSLVQQGYQPVIHRFPATADQPATPEQIAIRSLPREQSQW